MSTAIQPEAVLASAAIPHRYTLVSLLRDYFELTKARVTSLVVMSAWCGFYLAVRKPGSLRAGEAFELIPGPREVGITELFKSKMSRAKL